MSLVILGAGESGTGAALLAQKQGLTVFVSDKRAIAPSYKKLLLDHQIPYEENGHTISKLITAQEVIKSPGIANDALLVKQLASYAIPIIDEIAFAARYIKGRIIAVTGSNGKSTTVHLIYHLLQETGHHVALAGNVGHSFAKSVLDGPHDDYVLEVSSFQLENINTFKPTIACLLNITPDHLDRHASMEKYVQAKWNLLHNMTSSDHFIYNRDDPTILAHLNQQPIIPKQYPITQSSTVGFPIFSTHDSYCFNIENTFFSIKKDKIPLCGPHNQYNLMAAITATRLAGVSYESITAALVTFRGLPHRLEWCGAPKGVNCYNDSKATNVAATEAALCSFHQPIIWIAGGQDKGNDYTSLLPLVGAKVKAMICLGRAHRAMIRAFQGLGLPIVETQQMDTAVAQALSFASPREVILLSPACASFDLFKNFEDRGNQFRKIVQRYANKG